MYLYGLVFIVSDAVSHGTSYLVSLGI